MSKMRINLGQIIVITMLVLAGAGAFIFGYTLEGKRDEAAIKSLVTGLADNLSKTETESTASATEATKSTAPAIATEYQCKQQERCPIISKAKATETTISHHRILVVADNRSNVG